MDYVQVSNFLRANAGYSFYQPVVLVPGVIEIHGDFHEATKKLAHLIFSDIKGKTVLDLGCNTGFFVHESLRRGAVRAVGVDNQMQEISIAREVAALLGNRGEFFLSDLASFVPPGKFDYLLMLNITYHFRFQQELINWYVQYANKTLIVEQDNSQHPPKNITRCMPSPRCWNNRSIYFIDV